MQSIIENLHSFGYGDLEGNPIVLQLGLSEDSFKSAFFVYGYKHDVAVRVVAENEARKLIITPGFLNESRSKVGNLKTDTYTDKEIFQASQYFEMALNFIESMLNKDATNFFLSPDDLKWAITDDIFTITQVKQLRDQLQTDNKLYLNNITREQFLRILDHQKQGLITP